MTIFPGTDALNNQNITAALFNSNDGFCGVWDIKGFVHCCSLLYTLCIQECWCTKLKMPGINGVFWVQ